MEFVSEFFKYVYVSMCLLGRIRALNTKGRYKEGYKCQYISAHAFNRQNSIL